MMVAGKEEKEGETEGLFTDGSVEFGLPGLTTIMDVHFVQSSTLQCHSFKLQTNASCSWPLSSSWRHLILPFFS